MRLRPYISCRDFDLIKNWVPDERTHAMWCAKRFGFPIEKDNFDNVLSELAVKYADCPFVATDDNGVPIGFFCYSLNIETNEGMLKFVIVDPAQRGKGVGKELLRLALKYAFDITKADAVQLNVFSENTAAVKCYEGVGFTEKRTDVDAFGLENEMWDRHNMVIKRQ